MSARSYAILGSRSANGILVNFRALLDVSDKPVVLRSHQRRERKKKKRENERERERGREAEGRETVNSEIVIRV